MKSQASRGRDQRSDLIGLCHDLAFTLVRLESTGRLGTRDPFAAMWERNNRKMRAETEAQLNVLSIYPGEKDSGLDLGRCSGVVEIPSGFRCIFQV